MSDLYMHRLAKLIEKASDSNGEALDQAADKFAESIAGGGLVHLYGSGHSVLPCQEVFPRYGTYVGFNPLTDPRVMWHNVLGAGGVRELLWLERTKKVAEKFLDHQPLNPGNTIVIFGHSGRNSSGIDAAIYCQEAWSHGNSHHRHGQSRQTRFALVGETPTANAADIVIDTCAPIEDAIVPIESWTRPVSGSSTVLAMILVHELIARTATELGNGASNCRCSPRRR